MSMGSPSPKKDSARSQLLNQVQMQAQLEEQQRLMDELQAKYDAQLEAAQAGLTGDYGPLAEASIQNPDGSWTRPQYQTILDPETGLLREPYLLENTLDTRGLEQFREEALRDPGTESAWLRMAMEAQEAQRLNDLSGLGAQLNAATRSAYDDLAATGGLDSGARERVARGGLRDFMRARQDVNNQFNLANLDLRTTDEENRLNMLSQLPGMELQKSGFDADIQGKNIEAAMGERRYAFDNEMDAWTKNQKTWAANKQADAQRSASGGCFDGSTLVTMADGSKKQIKDIELGEETLLGGEVLQTLKGKSVEGDDWYDIHGVIVSGSHLILQDGTWVPARDYKRKKEVKTPETYFNLTTKNHLLFINDVLFSDMQDVDDYELTDREAMIEKNELWRMQVGIA